MTSREESFLYRETDHTADLRVEIYGRTREELFHHAMLAFYELLGLPGGEGRPAESGGRPPGGETLRFSGADEADVLVQLLGELLAAAAAERRRWVPREGGCRLTRDGDTVSLQVEGGWRNLMPQETEREREIKAVTYHEARIRRHGDGYVATVVMDL